VVVGADGARSAVKAALDDLPVTEQGMAHPQRYVEARNLQPAISLPSLGVCF